jgi:hypothetical protein
MVESGIARGEGARFGASESVTREQLAVMLYNYAKCEGCDVSARGDLSVFPDGGSVSAWARDALVWAIGMKLINGAADGGSVILDPQGLATHAQLETILGRFTENIGMERRGGQPARRGEKA